MALTKTVVDIGHGDIDIYVEGQLVLHVGQVSDDEVIDLFLYPRGKIFRSAYPTKDSTCECTHELFVEIGKGTDGKKNH